MANFMKIKAPKPAKPIKSIKSEVKKDENIASAEKEIQEIENLKAAAPVIKKPEPPAEVIEEVEEVVEEITEEPVQEEQQPEPEPEVVEEQEEVKPEPVAEDKPKKKKSSNRKKTEKKTEEPVAVVDAPVESISLDQAEEIMMSIVMPCGEGWEEEKERVNNLLNGVVITEELDPTSVKMLIADMSSMYREFSALLHESKAAYNNLKDEIENIKALNFIGSNGEERKLNSIKAVTEYVKDGKQVDLFAMQKYFRARYDFYESALKEIDTNKQMLITFCSVFKIELGKAY